MTVTSHKQIHLFLSRLLKSDWRGSVTRRRTVRSARMAGLQTLEDRALLATFDVTTTDDIVNPADGVLSLREAVIAANNLAGADVINLPAGNYARTIFNSAGPENFAAEGDLDIREELTINGAGQGTDAAATIINGGTGTLDRVFHVAVGVSVTWNSLTIQGGQAFDNGTIGSASHGGGILADAGTTLVLDDVLLQNNLAQGIDGGNQTGNPGTPARGGGLYASGSTTIVIRNNTLFQSNQANGGSGGSGAPGQGGQRPEMGAPERSHRAAEFLRMAGRLPSATARFRQAQSMEATETRQVSMTQSTTPIRRAAKAATRMAEASMPSPQLST